jgi:hypothetical protein
MRRWAVIFIVTAFTAMPLLFAQAPQQPGSIVGIVRDAATRTPVARATVTASGPKRLPSALTDVAGRFTLDRLDPGSYGLGVAKGSDEGTYGRRWVGGQGIQLSLAAGQRQEVEVLLWPTGSIAGTAYDERNAPLVEVAVTVVRIDDGGSGQRPFSTWSRTDDRGMFEAERLAPGRYAACVGIAHRTTYPEFDVPMVVRTSIFRDVRGPGGQILALSDEPLPPAADATGHPQTYVTTCSPSATALRDATEVSLQLGERRTGVDIHMRTERQFRVSGRIVQPREDAGDIDLSLIPVEARTPGLDRFVPSSASKGARFLFMSVPAGEYVLRARRNTGHSDVIIRDARGLWHEQRIDVRDADVSGLLVDMKLGGRMNGRFVCEDDPAARCWRGTPTFVEEPFMGGDAVAQDGSFTITGIRPGSYRIEVASYNVGAGWRLKSIAYQGRDVTNLPITLDAVDIGDLVVTMTRQRTVVSGIVRDDLSPTSDAVIVAFPEDASRWPRPRADQMFRTVSPNPEGRYEILDLPAGSYLIAAVRGPELNAWPSAATLQSLRSAASRVQVAFGQPATVNLEVRAK